MAVWKSNMVVMVESHRAIDGRSSGGTTWDKKRFGLRRTPGPPGRGDCEC
jgi:hypothetical protein